MDWNGIGGMDTTRVNVHAQPLVEPLCACENSV